MVKKDNKGNKPQATDTYEHIEEEERILGSLLEPLARIKGFKAALIMTHMGEILAKGAIDKEIELHKIGVVFNDIFRAAHEASEKIGLEACLETSIKTPKGIIVMRCSGVDALVHFHLIAILSSDGNHAFVRMELDKIIPRVLEVIG